MVNEATASEQEGRIVVDESRINATATTNAVKQSGYYGGFCCVLRDQLDVEGLRCRRRASIGSGALA